MFNPPEERNPLLHIMERLAGMGWLLATDTIHLSSLGSEGRKRRFRVHTEIDNAEFEFLTAKHQGCLGTLSSDDLQWTKADVAHSRDATELDAMRCYAGMYALERYIMFVPGWQSDLHLSIGWSERAGYTVIISPTVRNVWSKPWIFVLTPSFEITAMVPHNA